MQLTKEKEILENENKDLINIKNEKDIMSRKIEYFEDENKKLKDIKNKYNKLKKEFEKLNKD